jgi:hypothetical protein
MAGLILFRVGRPNDRALAWMSFSGCLGWLAVDLAFGRAFGDVFDPTRTHSRDQLSSFGGNEPAYGGACEQLKRALFSNPV